MSEKGEANRAKILEAARKIVAERGVHNTSLRAIASEAGISNGALYYYYNSKDLILYELMEQQNTIPKRLAQKVISSKDISGEQIENLLVSVFEGRIQDVQTTRMFMYLAQEAILGNEELQKSFAVQYEEWVDSLEEVLVTLLGVPKSNTSRGLAMLLEAVNEGMVLHNLLGLEQKNALDIIRKILTGNLKKTLSDLNLSE